MTRIDCVIPIGRVISLDGAAIAYVEDGFYDCDSKSVAIFAPYTLFINEDQNFVFEKNRLFLLQDTVVGQLACFKVVKPESDSDARFVAALLGVDDEPFVGELPVPDLIGETTPKVVRKLELKVDNTRPT